MKTIGQAPLKPRRIPFLLFLLLSLAGASGYAATVDFTGKQFKQDGTLLVTSTDTVASSLIYNVSISATGVSTGSFVPLFGSGDFGTVLSSLSPFLYEYLQSTIPDPSGKIPCVLSSIRGEYGTFDVPVAAGTVDFSVKGRIVLEINRNGTVTAGVKGLAFSERLNGRRVAVSGTYAVTTGMVTVEPAVATSSSAQPIIFSFRNPRIADSGTYAEESIFPGIPETQRIRAGSSISTFFVLMNNGPAADSFVIRLIPTGTPYVTQKLFDGKTNVTAQAAGSSGYTISNLPSSGQHLLRIVVAATRKAKYSNPEVVFSATSTTNSSTVYSGTYGLVY